MWETIKNWLKRRKQTDLKEREREIRAEAARRINIREVLDEVTGSKLLAICLDDTIMYTVPSTFGEDSLVTEMIRLREYYVRLWGPTPSIELL